MSRIACLVGYATGQETVNDITTEKYSEHQMFGDLVRNYKQEIPGDTRYDELQMANNLSLVAGEYAYQNFANIRYAIFMGTKWKVTSVEVQRPRLILTLGGVWNG